MFKSIFKKFLIILIYNFLILNLSYAENIQEILIKGNDRISKETILIFASISKEDTVSTNEINSILKNLYETNYFKDVKISIEDKKLVIFVEENPIIENINFNGIKSKTLRKNVLSKVKLKARSSYNEFLIKNDKDAILIALKNYGYFNPEVNVSVEDISDNKVNINFDIEIGSKAKIRKISFIGNKIFKDGKLKSVIISEEYKFWKFISGKKYLNENLVKYDSRLLKNFYLNKGYYNVKINSSFAKMLNKGEFELIYNIEAGNLVYFNNILLELPNDYDQDNFSEIFELFEDLKSKKYSINSIEKILNEIDLISINEQYQSVKASVAETQNDNLLNLTFKIEETDKFFIKKINIFGNNVTEESVIRNSLDIDEGDPYNEILVKKSINNIQNLNFFRSVKEKTIQIDDSYKILNIYVEEKPTGEIAAGAGYGTEGSTIFFSVSENNYLGKGIELDANVQLTEESIKGIFRTTNPNYKNSDKSLSISFEADEIDQLTNFGYKSNKTGFSVGTKFEYRDDLFLGLGSSSYYEKIETDSTASARQKNQEGDYWDTFLNINLNYDKRNQRFKATDGFLSNYYVKMPVISTNYSLTTGYDYKIFSELYENNISTLGFSLTAASSLNNKDVKLSERLYIPSRKLRGFVRGKVGPKDGEDYVGGNFVSTVNISSTLPHILSNLQTVDFSVFFDAANVWGVDYDSSIDDSNKIRSSFGLGVDWFTPIGPLNFSFAQDLSKHSNDKTETFRFNLGTTF